MKIFKAIMAFYLACLAVALEWPFLVSLILISISFTTVVDAVDAWLRGRKNKKCT